MSAGVKGLRVGVGPRGAYTSVGLPGTGLYGIHYHGSRRGRASAPPFASQPSPTRPRVPSRPNPWAVGLVIGAAILFVSWAVGALIVAGSLAGAVAYGRRPEARALAHLRVAERAFTAREVDVDSALAEVRAARDLDPRAPTSSAAHDIGVLYTELAGRGQGEVALRVMEAASAVLPEDPLVRARLGLAYLGVFRDTEAIPQLQAVVDQVPEVGVPLVLAYLNSDRPEDAIELLESSPELRAGDPGALLLLARAHESLGDPTRAIAALQRAPLLKRNLDEDLLAVHYRLGRLFEEVGDRRKARQHFRRVFNHDASYEDVADRL